MDGSFAQDLRFKRLAALFGVNHFIVSMINPLAVPLLVDPKTSRETVLRSIGKLAQLALKESLKTMRRLHHFLKPHITR